MNKTNADIDRLLIRGQECFAAGKEDEAEVFYRKALQQDPANAMALYNVAFLSQRRGRVQEAIDFYQQATAAQPGYKEAHNNLGRILQSQGRHEDAGFQYLQAIKADPQYADGYFGLGSVMRELHMYDKALEYYKLSADLSSNADVQNHIGYMYQIKGLPNDAARHFRKALEHDPDHAGALNNLGALYARINRFDDALRLYERVLAQDEKNIHAINNLARLYKATGQVTRAIEMYRKGAAIAPSYGPIRMNLLLAMVYAPGIAPEEITAETRAYNSLIAAPLYKPRTHDRNRDPDRKLRIGYVSPDFCRHPVNSFFEPLLQNHDRAQFEIFGYANVTEPDAITARLKGAFDHWRDIHDKSDDDAAAMIDADKIDILIDLAGYTASNRLLVFARKPAPVQATWLGYPATTGLTAMDYKITDIYADPPGMTEHLHTEKLWRMPEIFCCYGAPQNGPDVIDHPPFDDNGYVTFGCFNSFSKITEDVLTAWVRILGVVPDSRLLLEIAGLQSEKYRAEVEGRLRAAGMPLDRVILENRRRENQFHLYNRIDMALDPFPCNGGTTSMDTLWMGVPFVTLAGRHFVSRMGVSILTNAGMPELIAYDVDEYVEKAAALATDREKLRTLRHGLRDRVAHSPVMNQAVFARHIERAYREMWREWSTQ